MERHGFIRDMLDVKVLVLYVMAHVSTPIDVKKIYELCLQDDRLTYFDVCEAVPQLATSGHLSELAGGLYTITDKGREQGEITEDSVAYSVKQKALAAVEQFNRDQRRRDLVRYEVTERPDGDFSVILSLDDVKGNLMTLELMAPTQAQAKALGRAFGRNAEKLFQAVMTQLLSDAESPRG